MKKILIRADSSSTIGTGHIMRDLVLAKRDLFDSDVIFAVRDLPGNINHKIEEAGYKIASLASDDIDELANLAKREGAETVVIDHYYIGYEDEKRLKELTGATIFALDDTYEKHFCDILLNHNVYADANRYKGLVPDGCELRCGPKYTLLRDEFIEAKKRKSHHSASGIQHRKLQVFIAMGGADHSDKNIDILKVLENFENIHAHIVTTTANRNIDTLKRYAAGKKSVTLHIDTDKIANLMASSDFAIVTPSVTLNEVIFMELPFIAIQTADNQREMSYYLQKKGAPFLETFEKSRLQKAIEETIESLETELVDFTDLSSEEKNAVLAWRNHPDIRKWMLTKEPIPLKNHLAFIDSLRNRKDRLYFLVKYQGAAIGVIDFTEIDPTGKTAHFGLYTVPGTRGHGRRLMRSIINYGFKTMNLDALVAEVYKENEKALKLYEKFGFRKTGIYHRENQTLLRMELRRK